MYHDYSMQKILADLDSPSKKNFILDTDAYNEIDDQFAIAHAMLADNINLIAMTAAPFVNDRADNPGLGMELSYREMIRLRDMIDPEGKMNVACYRGSDDYMPNMNTPVYSEAAENIIRIVKETDGIVYVAVIGCFTNVASALLIDPSIKDKMVVIMIGSNCFGHHTCREFNLEQNPCTARVIFECGVPVIVLPACGGGRGTERLITTTAELGYYLKGQAGEIGDYLCEIFFKEEGETFFEDGRCNAMHRVIWDLGATGLLRFGSAVGEVSIVPAHTVTPDGNKWVNLENGKEMIYVEGFRRSAIMSDLFTLLRNAAK